MEPYKNVLDSIGNTPLVKLKSISTDTIEVYAKLENGNPGGSIKDRTALYLIREAEKEGKLKKGGTIIEPTAGNTGIGLALIGGQLGYQVKLCVPEKFSVEKQTVMKALGADVVLTPTEQGMEGAIRKSQEMAARIPNSYVPQQFSNPANVKAHYETTGPEMYKAIKDVNIFVAGFGTGGTFTGIARFLREKLPNVTTFIVEPQGSILGGGEGHPHKIEGIGVDDMHTAQLYDESMVDDIITVSDKDAHAMVHALAKEGLLVGSSSAAAAVGCARLVKAHKGEKLKIVTVFPDGADRYMSQNILGEFNEWKA